MGLYAVGVRRGRLAWSLCVRCACRVLDMGCQTWDAVGVRRVRDVCLAMCVRCACRVLGHVRASSVGLRSWNVRVCTYAMDKGA